MILGKTRGRGEQRLPNRRDITRCQATVDLEVCPGHVAAIIGGNWGDFQMSAWKSPLVQICTHGKERLLQLRLPHRTYPWGGAPTSCHASPQC